MGYRELFLVLVSVVLLTLLMTQINSNTVHGREALQQLEIEHTAASVAQQFIEEAKSKAFDETVVSSGIPANLMPGVFTPANALGPGSDVYPNFDDVDDYNGFNETLTVDGLDFTASIQVVYVQDSDLETTAGTQTFFKKMTVTVSSSWLPGSVTLKQVFSYFGV